MDTQNEFDVLNYNALILLEHLGNKAPQQIEIELAELIVHLLCGNYKMRIDQLDVIFSFNNPVAQFLKGNVEYYRSRVNKISDKKKGEVTFDRKDMLSFQELR